MECFNSQLVQDMQTPFTTLSNSIPDGERLFQEPLSQCAALGASVQVSGQNPFTFQVIYQLALKPFCDNLGTGMNVDLPQRSLTRIDELVGNTSRPDHDMPAIHF
jgi:hypothetical protein